MTPLRLEEAAIAEALAALPGWQRQGEHLYRDYRFGSFADALAFINATAAVALRMDHHPDWCNSHHRVQVWLTTHAIGGISALDTAMAAAMERLAENRP